MGREIGWEDESITGSFSNEKERQFRGKKGTTFVVRVMTGVRAFRRHEVDDVLDPDKNGEPRVFSMNCSRVWDDDAQDYVGECDGCEREYALKDRYVAGILVVGKFVGRASDTAKRVDPDDAPHYWDFGGDKYRKLSDIYLSLKRGSKKRKLRDIELLISCEDESFQKLNILKADEDHRRLTTKAHVTAWKEQGEDLVKQAEAPTPAREWKRRLKKKKPRRQARAERSDDDLDLEDKPSRSSRSSRSDPEPESTGDQEIDDLLGELDE